jgi:hypothetical protein
MKTTSFYCYDVNMSYSGRPAKIRFESKVFKLPESGCHLWTASLFDAGYGKFYVEKNKPVLAHRFSFILEHGSIPKGMCICHRCDVRSCVNPVHLFLGTIGDNNADRDNKGRHASRRQTHCKHGHPLFGENAYLRPGTSQRGCRQCKNDWQNKKRGHGKYAIIPTCDSTKP